MQRHDANRRDTGRPAGGIDLSLVIPCYNEAANLPQLIDRIEEAFTAKSGVEVLLVDNGSTDDTPRLLRDRLVDHSFIRSIRVDVNHGYGHGILAGLRATQGKLIGWTHADMQADPADALKCLDVVQRSGQSDNIYVKGRRYGRSIADVFFAIGMSIFESILLGKALFDINAQPNIMPRRLFDALADSAPHDFSLDLYFYYEAKRRGLKIVRIPVYFGERAHGVSHWNIDWRSKYRFIRRTISFSMDLKRRIAAEEQGDTS